MCHIFGFVFLLNSSQNMVLSTWQKGSEHLVMTEKTKLRERRHRAQIQTERGESEKVPSGGFSQSLLPARDLPCQRPTQTVGWQSRGG